MEVDKRSKKKKKEKKGYAQFFTYNLLFEISIHNYPGIMDVLQGRLASASESLGELTLSWLIIEWSLKINQSWPTFFFVVVVGAVI